MDTAPTLAPKRRLLWKIIQFPLTRLIIAAVFMAAAFIASGALTELVAGGDTGPGAVGVILTVLAVHGAYVLFVRLIERRPVNELSRKGSGTGLALGILMGAGLFSAVIVLIWGCGGYRVTGVNPWTAAGSIFLMSILAGYVEEIIARGIIFRIIEDGLGTWISLVISAVFFGAMHGGNSGATVMSSVSIALTAGIMLAATFILTRKLWVAIGMHFAWNFTQGGLFGVAVSGNEVDGILVGELSGHELIAGGAFGAEASIFTILLGLPLGVFLLVLACRRQRIVPPFWNRPGPTQDPDAALG